MTQLTWETASDWDAAQSEECVVHEVFGDHAAADTIELGYPTASEFSGISLDAYWPLDGSGSATDRSGNGNDLPNNGATTGATGIFGTTAYDFDGTDDYLGSSTDIFNYAQSFSMSVWVNLDVSEAAWIVDLEHAQNGGAVLRTYDDGGTIRFEFFTKSSTAQTAVDSTFEVNANQWYHIVCVHDRPNTTSKLFIDGALEDSRTDAAPLAEDSSDGFIVGTNNDQTGNSDSNVDGTVDELRVYGGDLSDTQAKALYPPGSLVTAAKTA